MGTRNLLKMLQAHAAYCQREYQPHKLPQLSSEEALEFQDKMSNSLNHFAMWIQTVHLPQDNIRRRHITEAKKR